MSCCEAWLPHWQSKNIECSVNSLYSADELQSSILERVFVIIAMSSERVFLPSVYQYAALGNLQFWKSNWMLIWKPIMKQPWTVVHQVVCVQLSCSKIVHMFATSSYLRKHTFSIQDLTSVLFSTVMKQLLYIKNLDHPSYCLFSSPAICHASVRGGKKSNPTYQIYTAGSVHSKWLGREPNLICDIHIADSIHRHGKQDWI